MKKIIALSIFLSICCISFSQINHIDLQGVFTKKYVMDNIQNLSWRPGTSQYSFIENDEIKLTDAKTKKTTVFLTLKDLKVKLSDLAKMPPYEWVDGNTLYFPSKKAVLTVTESQISSFEIIPVEDEIAASVENRLFVIKDKNKDVYVQSAKNGYKKVELCINTGKNIVFGEAVHRNEWGIDEGEYISPKGNYIAFYRMDENMVEDYPLVNTTTPIATEEPIKYPMAGRTNHVVQVGIFDVNISTEKDESTFLYVGTEKEDGEYLTNITFSPDDKFLYITHLNREQNHLKLIEYEASSGKRLRVLLEEHDNRYVEPNTRMIFLKNSNQFLWQSDRDGWNHLYLYSRDGKLIKQITKGNWPVISTIGFDEKESVFYFTTNKDMPTDRYVYAVNMKSGKLENLTPRAGVHTPVFSSDNAHFIDYYTSLEVPRNIYLNNSNGKITDTLLISKNPYQEHPLGKTSIFSIKNGEGDDLYCRMILPVGFDSTRNYPCLVYVYGGPHSQMVTNSFMSGGVYLQYLAQKGYVIFTLDNRGTAYRGAEFEKCIHRNLGALEAKDQVYGVNYLRQLPYIDSERIGLDGWSYGGFLVLTLMTDYPDLFKAASCGGPVVDWKWYEIMYGERYMDTPQENPNGYAASSIIPKIKNITGDLLVIHGAQDPTVVWQNSLELLNQAIKDGVMIDYFVYPTHGHNVTGIDRVHLWRKLEQFHGLHLK